MKGALSIRTSRLKHPDWSRDRTAVLRSVTLAVACLLTYEFVTQLLRHVYSLSASDDALGGMWAVIATSFVYRFSYAESVAAAVSRMAATLVSFVLCLIYLLLLPPSVWGLALLIGVGSLVVTLVGRPGDAITTTITTAVVMVVALLEPHNAWQQPILRLVDTAAGVTIGVAVAWIIQRATELRRRALSS